MVPYGRPMSEQERSDLQSALAKHRELFRFTVQGLTDEQAAMTPTDERALPRRADQARRLRGVGVGRLHRRGHQGDGGHRRQLRRPLQQLPDARGRDPRRDPGRLPEGHRPHRRGARARSTSTCRTRCRRRRGSSPARAGRPGGCSCTSSPRPPSTPATPTSSARPSTARSRWAETADPCPHAGARVAACSPSDGRRRRGRRSGRGGRGRWRRGGGPSARPSRTTSKRWVMRQPRSVGSSS